MKTKFRLCAAPIVFASILVTVTSGRPMQASDEGEDHGQKPAKTLYIWAGDQARTAPDSWP